MAEEGAWPCFGMIPSGNNDEHRTHASDILLLVCMIMILINHGDVLLLMENHVLRIVILCGNTCQDLKVVLICRGWFMVTLMKLCGNMSIF